MPGAHGGGMGRLTPLAVLVPLLLSEALLLAALIVGSQPGEIPVTEWPEASDRRLLNASQIEELGELNRTAVVFDGEWYVYEDGGSLDEYRR